MKKKFFTVASLLFIAGCGSSPSPQKGTTALSFETFLGWFDAKAPQNILFSSDSSYAPKGHHLFQPEEQNDYAFLPENLKPMGGFAYQSYQLEGSPYTLISFMMMSDITGPYFILYNADGVISDHLSGYDSPGFEPGFESHESAGFDALGNFFKRDITITWDEADSAGTVKKTDTTLFYQPFLEGKFNAVNRAN
jgi:hypothetical protein